MKKVSGVVGCLGIMIGCLTGCGSSHTPSSTNEFEMVSELVATQEIPAGTTVKDGLFRAGKLYYMKGQKPKTGPQFEEAPEDLFPSNLTVLEGKKVVRAIKKGETLKIGDIAESDGSPLRLPTRR
jgi:hypothetical protein